MECKNLEEVRENIDIIDNNIIQLIAERETYVIQASTFKKDEDGVRDKERVEKVISNVRHKAEMYNANPKLVEDIYRKMIDSFISIEIDEFKNKTQ